MDRTHQLTLTSDPGRALDLGRGGADDSISQVGDPPLLTQVKAVIPELPALCWTTKSVTSALSPGPEPPETSCACPQGSHPPLRLFSNRAVSLVWGEEETAEKQLEWAMGVGVRTGPRSPGF